MESRTVCRFKLMMVESGTGIFCPYSFTYIVMVETVVENCS